MAINMMCMNNKCKYYWEDSCTRNLREERIEINEVGKCLSFEEGVSEWYEIADKVVRENREELKKARLLV